MATQEEEKVGLQCLADGTLAAIVESELSEQGKLSQTGEIALQELKERTPE